MAAPASPAGPPPAPAPAPTEAAAAAADDVADDDDLIMPLVFPLTLVFVLLSPFGDSRSVNARKTIPSVLFRIHHTALTIQLITLTLTTRDGLV